MINFLKSLKILDHDQTLNISALALLVVTVRLGIGEISWPLVTDLFLVLANYNLKKFWALTSQKKNEGIEKRMATLEAEVKALVSMNEMRKLGR